MYMLKSVGDRTPPCETQFFNCRCVDVLFLNVVYALSFDVVCGVFNNGVWDVCFG